MYQILPVNYRITPPHILFISQPDLAMTSGVHPSLHLNCCHQIIYANFNLKIYFLSPYKPKVWHYKKNKCHLNPTSHTDN